MAPANISMALPVVKTLLDCSDYSITAQPYLDQLRVLPELVFQHVSDPAALKQLYIDTNPFVSGLAFSIALSPFFLLASEINQNFSQIDRVWSILPTLYHAHWAIWSHLAGLDTSGLFLRLAVSLVWSARLTFNYWRRGGYQVGSEDYRWMIIKDIIGQPAFFVLDVIFIATIQNVLLFIVTSPTYVQLLINRLDTASDRLTITTVDLVFASFILCLVAVTGIADQQQWNYQTAKYRYRDTGKVPAGCGFSKEQLDIGFRTTGLWAYSRHPNFLCEQSVWWTFYMWSAIKADNPRNWTIVGPIAYSLIFTGSTPITEWISKKKYPWYEQYQMQVGTFFPMSIKPPQITREAKTSNGSTSDADNKNAADYAQAKKRYDLR